MPAERERVPEEVFLSHSSKDRRFARKLAAVLRQHGVPVWFSETDIRGAQQWHDEIGDALRRCDWFVLVLSPDAVSSMWVKRELVYSLQQDRYEGRIAPIICKSCSPDDLSWTLSQMQMTDFRASFHDGCRDLLRIWGIGYRRKGKA